jgi:hypothetical protein
MALEVLGLGEAPPADVALPHYHDEDWQGFNVDVEHQILAEQA